MRRYLGTNEPCTGDCVRMDTPEDGAFMDNIIEGIDEDGTVHLVRPHCKSHGGKIWGVGTHTESYSTTLSKLVENFKVLTIDRENEKIDNRNLFPDRISAGRR